MSDTKRFSRQEISLRNSKSDLYVIIDNRVYDLTKFQDDHPGGHEVLQQVAGKDGTEEFHDVGHSLDAKELMKKYLMGELVDEDRVELEKPRRVWEATAPTDTSNLTDPVDEGFLSSWRLPVVLGVLATLLYYLFL
ncbi:unnamed protein product [Leptosia nina]|uniref:Cytochrome b5 heme-binding domain-containing protein n=1 Tax=Leptosia nina TaxID=320188 RepID=A0AAV1J5F3_9NEOP